MTPGQHARRRLFALAATISACWGVAALAVAPAWAAGTLPPRNPGTDCDATGATPRFNLHGLDACRAKEGVGSLVLPSNWSALSGPEQLLVVIDLERANRGLAPVVGLSSALDVLAQAGASTQNDPQFPQGGFTGGGGLWSGGYSAIGADYGWMYDDGWGGYDINLDCSHPGGSVCWMHRDIILWRGPGGPLVAGGGVVSGSYAFEILSGYGTKGLSFSWAHELRYFSQRPRPEPLGLAASSTTGGRQLKRHPRRHRHRSGDSQLDRHSARHSHRGRRGGDRISITFG
ncbi:MAG: hypothetical protein ACRDKL_02620 [Solirubrobacteraceae bacterium]